MKQAAKAHVLRFQLPDGAGRAYYKAYFARSVWDAFKHKVRASRACRSLRASRMLKSWCGGPDANSLRLGDLRLGKV
jgi:hypothetical protein